MEEDMIVFHGIHVSECTETDASIAIQFRTLLSTEVSTELDKSKLVKPLCQTIIKSLKECSDGTIRLPTVDEYKEHYNKLQKQIEEIIKDKQIAPTVELKNIP